MDDELLPQSEEGIEGYGVTPDAVASVLDGVGQSARALIQPEGEAAPAATPEVPQQGGLEPAGAHNPDPAGSTPAPATATPGAATPGTLPGIPEPPAPPALTGDPQKDVEQNLLYHWGLTDH